MSLNLVRRHLCRRNLRTALCIFIIYGMWLDEWYRVWTWVRQLSASLLATVISIASNSFLILISFLARYPLTRLRTRIKHFSFSFLFFCEATLLTSYNSFSYLYFLSYSTRSRIISRWSILFFIYSSTCLFIFSAYAISEGFSSAI